MTVTGELHALAEEIREHALRFGLDFFDTYFELLDFDQLNEIASFGGFPTRYPHWRFGMIYEEMMKGHAYGLRKIYELVINNDPVVAYLVRSNSDLEQKLVMAHVFGHADFFRHNGWFAATDRRMLDRMGGHSTRVRRHIDRHGHEKVERFLDACMSLENLIDPLSLYMKRSADAEQLPNVDDKRIAAGRVHKLRVERPYMEQYINPPDVLQAELEREEQKLAQQKRFPPEPVRDVVTFLLEHAPLADWQADCLEIIRREAYYFAPQRMTKIMNEGWASYVHSKLLTTRMLQSSEVVEYCSKHAATLSTVAGQINPYNLGVSLYQDIEGVDGAYVSLGAGHGFPVGDITCIDISGSLGFGSENMNIALYGNTASGAGLADVLVGLSAPFAITDIRTVPPTITTREVSSTVVTTARNRSD